MPQGNSFLDQNEPLRAAGFAVFRLAMEVVSRCDFASDEERSRLARLAASWEDALTASRKYEAGARESLLLTGNVLVGAIVKGSFDLPEDLMEKANTAFDLYVDALIPSEAEELLRSLLTYEGEAFSSGCMPTVLVVEDSKFEWERIQAKLEGKVKLFRVATETQALYAVEKNPIDLVIMDFEIISGATVRLVRTLRNTGYDMPIVTSSSSRTFNEELMGAGASHLASKENSWIVALEVLGIPR